MLVYLALALGCFLLYQGGTWLLDGVTAVGKRLGLPQAIVGLVLVSLGTSAPELFVSVGSSIQGHGAMAAGNVVGSNIINIAIVLGLAASATVLLLGRVLQQQLFGMLCVSLIAAFMLSNDTVSRLEGLVLLVVTGLSFIWAIRSPDFVRDAVEEAAAHAAVPHTARQSALLTAGGIVTLMLGAESLIWGGLQIAERLQWSETLVALTITALGTSLPEIAATVVAIVRRETSLAVGNVIGSNLLNLGLVLGLSATVAPLNNLGLGTLTLSVFVGLTVCVAIIGFTSGRYARWVGFGLLGSYGLYAAGLLAL